MTKRETRVINAFLNCIAHGEYTEDYAITLIEDNQRYGWLTDRAKEYFYEHLPSEHGDEEEEVKPETEPEPAEDVET